MDRRLGEELSFSHDRIHLRSAIKAIEDTGAIEFVKGTDVPLIKEKKFQSLFELVFFGFFYEGNRVDEERDYLYVTLSDNQIASLLTDKSILESPSTGSRLRDHPLRDMAHAYGHCEICPAKGFLGKNLGLSTLKDEVGRAEDIEVPDTYPYSVYDFRKNLTDIPKGEAESCNNCQSYMVEWLNSKIQEDVNYLWGLGGTGMVHKFKLNSDYNILDVLVGKEPPGDFEVDSINISDRTKRQSDGNLDVENGVEPTFNLLLAMYLANRLGFDDYWVNCKIRKPYSVKYELDVILIDYTKKIFVCIETTGEREIDDGRFRQKQRAANQLQALADEYDWQQHYIYLTPGDISDIREGTAERLTYESNNSFEVVGTPPDIDTRPIRPKNAINTPPKQFGELLRRNCQGWLDEICWRLSPSLNGFYSTHTEYML